MTTPKKSQEEVTPAKIKSKSLRRKVTSYTAIFITSLLCLLAILYSSPWGTQASISFINKFSDVTLIYKSGMFSEKIEFSDVLYQNDDVKIHAKNAILKFHLRCFWQKKLCIDSLNIGDLSLKIKSSNAPKPEFTLLEMPISIKIKKLLVAKTAINLTDQVININGFTSPINIKKSTFTFNSPSIKEITVADIVLNKVAGKTAVTKAAIINQQKNDISTLALPEIQLPFELKVVNFKIDRLSNNLSILDNLPKKITDINIGLTWFKSDLFITLFKINYGSGLTDINGKLSLIKNYPLDIQLKHQLNNNTYWPEVNDSAQIINIKGDLSQLDLQFKSEGSLALTGNANINIIDNNFPYNLNLEATKLPVYNQVSQHLHPSVLSLASQGDINKQTLSLNSVLNGLGYKNAKTSLKLTHNKLIADKVTIEEFALNDAKNNLSIKGHFAFSDKPSWNLKIKSTGFSFPQFKHLDDEYDNIKEWMSGRIKGNLDTTGIYNKENSSITLTNTHLTGEVNKMPFELSGEINLSENLQLKPSHLSLSLFDSHINFSGYSDKEWHVKGNIDVPNTNKFYSEINGNVSTRFDVTGPLDKPKVLFKHDITDFAFKKSTSPFITVQGSYSPFEEHLINAQIKSKSINWLSTELTQVVAKINADINQQRFDVKWEGDFKSKFLLNGLRNEDTKNWVGIIAGAEFNYLSQHWQPDTDVIIDYNNQTQKLSLNKHCWNNQGLNICLPKEVSFSDSGSIPLSLYFNSSYFNETFAPNDILVNTIIEGDATINWTPNKHYVVEGDLSVLAGNILLDEKEIGLPVKVLSAWDEGRLTFKLNDDFVQTQLTLSPDNQTNANNNYDFYSNINLAGKVTFKGNFPISANIDIDNFNLRPFQSISHEITLLEGVLHTQVNVTGDLKNPKVNGEINLDKGSVKLLKSPNVINDVKINLALLNTNATLKGTFNIDKDTGFINGDADWKKEKRLNLSVNAEHLSILVPPHIEATIAPQINAVLTPDNLKISGKVNVLSGILRVINLPEGSVELTNDVIFVDTKGNEIIKEKRFNIESDIRVFIDEAFQLTGQGFNGNLAGDIRVQHSNQQPIQIFGNLNIPDGRYHAYGQRLQIERGKVAFNGPMENPHIDIKATRTIPKENIKVGVEIKGLANALTLKLISTPALSRAQTLSYLLRGQGLKNDAPDDSGIGVALGAALANYSGILKQIDKLPLINNVEIEGDSSQVSIAGYLGKRIYVKYGVGVNEPVNELTVRLFLMSRLWVETISGLENSADIYYSFDSDL
ncbi:translocation/assembly module TamB domain-containing protein [Pseudocolwellia agarivorans]|uniref:translocation/assembly module TamB domain-containing protein n=1 Tax=Pseudocolwellia agarivorans TaxID=1911682 RepID=UPI000985516C|nr:translocation/assembly module TamB domain-containing protein [Pseudocolwellia agarivorans]